MLTLCPTSCAPTVRVRGADPGGRVGWGVEVRRKAIVEKLCTGVQDLRQDIEVDSTLRQVWSGL